jgi:hypothetical protein
MKDVYRLGNNCKYDEDSYGKEVIHSQESLLMTAVLEKCLFFLGFSKCSVKKLILQVIFITKYTVQR